MHELPEVLTNSMRSYRGSVHGNSTRNEVIDLEKGVENYGDKEFDQALSPTESSLVVVRTVRNVGLTVRTLLIPALPASDTLTPCPQT